jgi:glycine/D-amino acid oxidase-like deaminating enzyme
MSDSGPLALDAVIFGGGAAGLWLLDELTRRGRSVVLLEAGDLGAGQTVASQGIIHGGMKYSLGGLATPSARAIREMPLVWRRCLAGESAPDLTRTRIRSEFCYLWQTTSLTSRLAMAGARVALRTTPTPLAADARPAVLDDCPGEVCRLDEQVIDPPSFIGDLADQHRRCILAIDAADGLSFETGGPGVVRTIRLVNGDHQAALEPRHVFLTAGSGNETLRRQLDLEAGVSQRRPLHMAMVRGDLPALNGHCVDGGHTRLTITSARDCEDRVVWQLGGQIAEDGEHMDGEELIEHTRREVAECVPGLAIDGAAWSTYRADRVEARTRAGRRPRSAQVETVGNTTTGWPTKLALVPVLARKAMRAMRVPTKVPETPPALPPTPDALRDWPRPAIALPPWETENRWIDGH